MGALTCSRKPSVSSNVDHISRKPRLSTSMYQIQEHPFPRKSIATRVSKYPSYITPIKREIHAPCRPSRFRNVGNFLAKQYDTAKRSALEALRFVKKDKEVINIVDDDEEIVENGVFGDSAVEELGNGVAEKTGLDNGSGQIWEGSNGVVAKTGLDNGPGQRGKESNGVVEILDNSSVVTVSNDVNLKNEEKMLDSLSLSNKFDDSSVPMYKKLLGSAEKRDDNLKRIQFQIEYTEKLRETHQLLRPQKKEEHVKEHVITEPFVPLAEGEEAEVSHALSNANRTKVLVTHENSNIDITGEILQCLRPGAWLNDEVINVYLELLKEREKREPKKFLKCHFFNTFFYKKLISGKGVYNYQPVKRWTSQRKLGYCLFECDKIFVPIHKQVHWCLAVINKKDEKFQYLDSLGGRDNQVLRVLARYFIDEVKDKTGKDIDVSSWKLEFVEDIPVQQNGVNYLDISSDFTTVGGPAFSGLRNNEDLPPEWFDCGMFMLKYADFYSRDKGLCFNQNAKNSPGTVYYSLLPENLLSLFAISTIQMKEHMPYFRSRTAKEILWLKAE